MEFIDKNNKVYKDKKNQLLIMMQLNHNQYKEK